MATVKHIQIDGVALPTPALEGVSFTPNKMHSANTGRLAASLRMVGTILGVKQAIKITWPPLSAADAKKIDNLVSSTTFEHTLKIWLLDDTVSTYKVYFDSPTYTIYSWAQGLRHVKGVAIEAIEC